MWRMSQMQFCTCWERLSFSVYLYFCIFCWTFALRTKIICVRLPWPILLKLHIHKLFTKKKKKSWQKSVPNFVAIAYCVNCFNASYQLQVFEIVLLQTNPKALDKCILLTFSASLVWTFLKAIHLYYGFLSCCCCSIFHEFLWQPIVLLLKFLELFGMKSKWFFYLLFFSLSRLPI